MNTYILDDTRCWHRVAESYPAHAKIACTNRVVRAVSFASARAAIPPAGPGTSVCPTCLALEVEVE